MVGENKLSENRFGLDNVQDEEAGFSRLLPTIKRRYDSIKNQI